MRRLKLIMEKYELNKVYEETYKIKVFDVINDDWPSSRKLFIEIDNEDDLVLIRKDELDHCKIYVIRNKPELSNEDIVRIITKINARFIEKTTAYGTYIEIDKAEIG